MFTPKQKNGAIAELLVHHGSKDLPSNTVMRQMKSPMCIESRWAKSSHFWQTVTSKSKNFIGVQHMEAIDSDNDFRLSLQGHCILKSAFPETNCNMKLLHQRQYFHVKHWQQLHFVLFPFARRLSERTGNWFGCVNLLKGCLWSKWNNITFQLMLL